MKTLALSNFTKPNRYHATLQYALFEHFKSGYHPISFYYEEVLDDFIPIFTQNFLTYLETTYKLSVSPISALAFVHNFSISKAKSHVPIGDPVNLQPQQVHFDAEIKYNIINPEKNVLDIKYFNTVFIESNVSVRFFQILKDIEGKE